MSCTFDNGALNLMIQRTDGIDGTFWLCCISTHSRCRINLAIFLQIYAVECEYGRPRIGESAAM